MKYFKIANKGLLDIRLVSLMGGTTKRGNDYKIGKFGSGLKYALAWLIRNNIDFKIFIGNEPVKIETKQEFIQGTNFDVLYINGERTSISSSMGIDWEAWMIVREILCNAIDEGEFIKEITDAPMGQEGWTTFCLQLIDGIKDTVDKWDNYFLHDMKPIYETADFAIYPPSDKLSLYKNGVLIHREKETKKGVFSYDIKNASINELREYKGYMGMDITYIIKALDKRSAEIFLTNLNEDCFEHSMDYNYFGDWAQTWKDTIGQAKIISSEDLAQFRAKGVPIDESSLIVLPPTLYRSLSNRFDGISAVRRADKVSAFYETFDSELELKIKSALAILESCNYEVHPELKFIYGEFGNKNVFARVNTDEKTVMFSTELKNKSMFAIVACIIEEDAHFKTGHEDETRAFQQYWIDLYTKTLLEKNEVVL